MPPKTQRKTPKKTGPASGTRAAAPAKTDKEKKKDLFASPRGMHDITPQEMPLWEKIYDVAERVADFYNFSKIETPIVERVELFERGVGEDTDIVEKEMYTLHSRGDDKLALRPEMTASVMRSYFQHSMHRLPQPQRFFYSGPVFRYERPQAGRYRQHHQFGIEIIGGESDPIYDAQIITALYRIADDLKIKPLIVHINSIGCRMCRPNYRKKLTEYYKDKEVCKDCEKRLKQNPLRLLDCKKEVCQPIKEGAPSILDSLCSPCRSHLKQVLEYIEEIELPYTLNPMLARGLDYYNRTVFEIFVEGSDLAIGGGGRYDYLAETIGGRPTPAAGGALGIERIVDILNARAGNGGTARKRSRIFIIHIGDLAKKRSLLLMEEFRRNNIPLTAAFGKNSLSGQLELANKAGAPFALIIGQKEVYEESVIIRDMETGVQESIPFGKVVDEVKRRMK